MRPKINTPPSVELPANTFTTCPNCGVKYWVGTWHSCPVRQTAVKCPVCEGSGRVRQGDLKPTVNNPLSVACHGCDGKGWVKV